MHFNENKSKAMFITRKRNIESTNIYINNRRLEIVKGMKYLGIYLTIGLLLTQILNT